MINVYCDESCHLENDSFDIMLIGALSCDKRIVHSISDEIRQIKEAYGLPKSFEVKWTKVSPAKVDFYSKLIEYFFSRPELGFRCVIALGKNKLNHAAYHQTYDEWYYKIYYQLLSKLLNPNKQYCVFVDIKDTCGSEKVEKLREYVNKHLCSFNYPCLHRIQIVKSDEIELLQICDLLIGAIGYYNRYIRNSKNSQTMSPAKQKLCSDLIRESQLVPVKSTSPDEDKFNLFFWEPNHAKC